MKQKIKKMLVRISIMGILVCTIATVNPTEMGGSTPVSAEAKATAKPKLNRKRITLKVGKTFTLKAKKGGKIKKWKVSNKKVAAVSQKGVKKAKIRAKKAGKARITAVFRSGKKVSCLVVVKKKTAGSTETGEFKKDPSYPNESYDRSKSSRVLSNGKKQSIDSIRFAGVVTTHAKTVHYTMFNDKDYACDAGVDVETTNISKSRLSYKWEVSNKNVFEFVDGVDNKKSVKLRPLAPGETYITVTVSYDGLKLVKRGKFALAYEEGSIPKYGIQKHEDNDKNVCYMYHETTASNGHPTTARVWTGSNLAEEKRVLSQYSPRMKKFFDNYYGPVSSGTDIEKLNAIYRFIVDSGLTLDDSLYETKNMAPAYSINLLSEGTGPRKTWSGGFWYLCYLSGLSAVTIEETNGYAWNGVVVDGSYYGIDPVTLSAKYASEHPNTTVSMYMFGDSRAPKQLAGNEDILANGQISNSGYGYSKEDMCSGYEYLTFYGEPVKVLKMDTGTKTFILE